VHSAQETTLLQFINANGGKSLLRANNLLVQLQSMITLHYLQKCKFGTAHTLKSRLSECYSWGTECKKKREACLPLLIPSPATSSEHCGGWWCPMCLCMVDWS